MPASIKARRLALWSLSVRLRTCLSCAMMWPAVSFTVQGSRHAWLQLPRLAAAPGVRMADETLAAVGHTPRAVAE